MPDDEVFHFCPFCGARVIRRGVYGDPIVSCPEHGALDGLTDVEWVRIAKESGVADAR